jgi:phosphate-selective porin OprO/OprP
MDQILWANTDPAITDPAARNYFEFRRLRLLADGVGYGVYDFRIQIDIEPESGDGVTTPVADIKDAYLTMHEVALLQRWRIGNFFVPFSLEQVTNDTNNIFLERSIPTQGIFAADREVGMAFYGVNDAQNVTWTGGFFFDSISESLKERIDDNQGLRLSGRVTWLPYYDEPSNGRYLFHTGLGILYTEDQDNLVRFSARPQIHEGPRLIDTGLRPAGNYTTGNLELATVWGPFSVQSELFLSSVNLASGDAATLYGAYVYGSYFLTGENRIYDRYGQHGAQFARNVPYSNFFLIPGGVGSGAWELKTRISYLDLDALGSGRYNDLTVGCNWYWTDRIRVMFDWIHPLTSEGTTPFGATQSDILAMRFDYNF